MKEIRITTIAGLAVVAAIASASPPSTAKARANALATFGRLQFIQNAGQWDRHVRFLGHAPGVDMWITDTGVTYDYYRDKSGTRKGHTVSVSFAGGSAAKNAEVVGVGKKAATMSYFVGNDKSKWIAKAQVYDAATIKNLYQGIDLVAYFDQNRKLPRYDLVVHPGANPSKIAMRYAGADRLKLAKNGSLGYATSLGRVEERELLAYQPKSDSEIGKLRDGIASSDTRTKANLQKVAAKVKIGDDGLVRFALSNPDPSRSVVIDPLVWSTFLGSQIDEIPSNIAVGPDGSVFVSGKTSYHSSLPITPGAYSSPKNSNIFCSKFSANGSSLLYTAIVGGDTSSGAYSHSAGLAVDSSGSAIIAGSTYANNFPTVNAIQTALPGRARTTTGYLFKLSPDASTLRYSTYIRGNAVDDTVNIQGVALDSSGAPIIVGLTTSHSLISSGGLVSNEGSNPGFCIKLTSNGSQTQFATYLGGANTAAVCPNGVALDSANNVYITGYVDTPGTYPTTSGAYQPAIPGITNDDSRSGFVTKIHSDGSRFDYSTLLGPDITGSNYDINELYGIAVDTNGAAYVMGFTQSQRFPVTPGAYQTAFPDFGGTTISKLSPDGKSLVYSTFYCALHNGTTYGYQGMFVDKTGVLTFSGGTIPDSIPVVSGAVEPVALSDNTSFIARLSANGSSLLYSSYFGLWNNATVSGIAPVPGSSTGLYLAGGLSGQAFPTTTGAYQTDAGRSQAFLARIDLTPSVSIQLPTYVLASSDTLVGTVTLPSVATDATIVYLTGSPYLTVSSPVIIPRGQQTGAFTILANTVTTNSTATILAKANGSNQGYGYNALIVIPTPQVSSLVASPTSVIAGVTNVTLKITLHAPAGGSGSTIKILNSNVNALDLPAQSTVVVPAGKSTYSFTVKSKVVASEATANLSCVDSQNATTSGGAVTVKPLLPTALSTGAPVLVPGNTYVGKVNLNGKVLSATTVTLTSNNPYVGVPGTVTVPAGSNTASFDITPSASFPGPAGTVNITASLPGGSVQRAAKISPILVSKLALTAKTLYGGYSTNATVTLSQAAPTGGFSVPVTSSVAGAPATVTVVVPAGSKTGTGVTTLPVDYAGSDQTVTLTASKNGSGASTTVAIKALKIIGVSMSSTNVKGGATATLLVKFNAPAMYDANVTLTSDSGSVIVPSTAVLSAGQRAVSVTVDTKTVSTITTAHILVTFHGSQATATLRLVK